MQWIKRTFFPDLSVQYIQNGFNEEQAVAVAWLAAQKPRGKTIGAIGGAFIAFSWGHVHDKILAKMNIRFNRLYTQFAIFALGIAFGDYIYCVRRYGANEQFGNWLMLNNNLFMGNLDSLVKNFDVMNRKFTPVQIQFFTQRANAMRKSNIPLTNRKWVHNPYVETVEQFERRKKFNLNAPWEDLALKKTIQQENKNKERIVYAPSKLSQLIDKDGWKVHVANYYRIGIKPIV